MDSSQVYKDLARHLDRDVVVGAPLTSTLIEILEILFPGREAQVACRLPLQNKTLSELEALFPEQGEALADVLADMVKRGTVFSVQPKETERIYRLLPSVVGWAETPYWGAQDTEDARRLAPLWIKYREEAFGRELARGLPALRVIPVLKALKDETSVLSFDRLVPKVEALSFCAVGHCPCRQIKRYVGEGCDHSTENCMHFGSIGRYMVQQGMAREITPEETLKILAQAHEEGLVHSVDNLEGHISTICNCCGCCCAFIDTKKKLGLNTISRSNYLARVESGICAGCGTCETRCPMDAITVGDDGSAVVDEKRCLGCGVCTPSCSTGAVALVPREEIASPPKVSEFLAARYK